MTITMTAIHMRPAVRYARAAEQMRDHGTLDPAIIAPRLGQWMIRIDLPADQYVRGKELYCVTGRHVETLRVDGVLFIHYDDEANAVYDYEGTVCDLTPETERLTFTMTLFDPTGRAVARYDQARRPKRKHTVESMTADHERQKLQAKERLPLAA